MIRRGTALGANLSSNQTTSFRRVASPPPCHLAVVRGYGEPEPRTRITGPHSKQAQQRLSGQIQSFWGGVSRSLLGASALQRNSSRHFQVDGAMDTRGRGGALSRTFARLIMNLRSVDSLLRSSGGSLFPRTNTFQAVIGGSS